MLYSLDLKARAVQRLTARYTISAALPNLCTRRRVVMCAATRQTGMVRVLGFAGAVPMGIRQEPAFEQRKWTVLRTGGRTCSHPTLPALLHM